MSLAVLFSHNGAGSQVKVNKASSTDTASHLFQTGFSGRAEFGLSGDDNFHAKVSPDGSTWYEGLLIDAASGAVTFPSGLGETGTWTPTVDFQTTGDFSPTYNVQAGAYRLIDDLVFVSLVVDFDSNAFTTASGKFQIGGFPFAAHNNADLGYQAIAIGRLQNLNFGGTGFSPSMALRPGTDLAWILENSSAGLGGSVASSNDLAPSTSGIRIYAQGLYQKD